MPIPPRQFGDYQPTEYQLREVVWLALLWLIAYGLIALSGMQPRHRVQTAQRTNVQVPYRDVVFMKLGQHAAEP